MGEKAKLLQRLLDSAYEAEDELLDENTALRRQLHEYKETVEVLGGLVQILADTIYAKPEDVEPTEEGTELDASFDVTVVSPEFFDEFFSDDSPTRHPPTDCPQCGGQREWSGHTPVCYFCGYPAFAWSPDFDVDGADAPVLDFDLEED